MNAADNGAIFTGATADEEAYPTDVSFVDDSAFMTKGDPKDVVKATRLIVEVVAQIFEQAELKLNLKKKKR